MHCSFFFDVALKLSGLLQAGHALG